jgi:peroxiredoxin
VNLGDHVPDLAFATTDGRTVHLADFRGEAMVLVFMRHLG